jgi:hypothetical protein
MIYVDESGSSYTGYMILEVKTGPYTNQIMYPDSASLYQSIQVCNIDFATLATRNSKCKIMSLMKNQCKNKAKIMHSPKTCPQVCHPGRHIPSYKTCLVETRPTTTVQEEIYSSESGTIRYQGFSY